MSPTPTPIAGPQFGAVAFPGVGGTGDCSSGIYFTASGETATVAIVQPGYTGTYTVADTTPANAGATVSGTTLTITATASGTTYITVADSYGSRAACNISVTVSGGTVH